jgi:NhaP-type Na+/H+ or K+/H+ antiporter
VLRGDPEELNRFTEEVASVLSGIMFVLFGVVLLGPVLADLRGRLALYAVLSLTLARMVPVAIAHAGLSIETSRRLDPGQA